MLDFENSGILIAPLLPWNIAAYVPVVMMGANVKRHCLLPMHSGTTPLLVTTTEAKLNQSYANYKINHTLITKINKS